MKTSVMIACMIAGLGSLAHADVSDSGSAVILGTVTVQGNAFGVGGSSFSVRGGSATLAYEWNPGSERLSGPNGTITTGSSITASAFFGDGSHLTNVSALPVGTILAYAGGTVPAGTLECNGTSYSTSTYSALYNAIGCAWGCADSGHFNVPDLRGVFLRGWNHSASTNTYHGDQDAVSRSTGAVGGNSGDNVGSYQDDFIRSHTHTTAFGGPIGAAMATGGFGSPAATNSGNTTNASGGNETRPKNAYVLFAIKYDASVLTSNGISITNAGIALAGSSGTVTTGSSVTASAFFGDASHLTGLVFQAKVSFSSFTTSGTFKPAQRGLSNGATIYIMVVGGGGGGGSTDTTASHTQAGGGGGGGQVVFTTATVSGDVTVTIGAGGAGAANATSNGSAGGTSSFGGITAGGGGGGGAGLNNGTAGTGANGGGGGVDRPTASLNLDGSAGGGGGSLTPGVANLVISNSGSVLGNQGTATSGNPGGSGVAAGNVATGSTSDIADMGGCPGQGILGPLHFNQTIMYGAGGGGGMVFTGTAPNRCLGFNNNAGAGGTARVASPCNHAQNLSPTSTMANTGQGGGGGAGITCAQTGTTGADGYVLVWWYE